MSENSALDAWFRYAINLAELVYSMKLETYEASCQELLEDAVQKAAVAVATLHSAPSAGEVATDLNGASEDGSSASPITPCGRGRPQWDAAADTAVAAAALKTHDELLALSCMTRPPTLLKKPEDCLDSVEAEKEAIYHALGEGYALTAEDEAAARACKAARETYAPAPQAQSDHATAPSTTKGAEDLLYGELTSLGVRQLHRLSTSLIQAARKGMHHDGGARSDNNVSDGKAHEEEEGATAVEPGFVMEAIDIGSGTGKLLFEWSRLASAEYLQHKHPALYQHLHCRRQLDRLSRQPQPQQQPENSSQTASAATPSAVPPSLVGSFAFSSEADAMSCCGSSSAFSNHGSDEKMESLFNDSVRERHPHLHPYPQQQQQQQQLAGWLGIGVELVPSRMSIARAALAPGCLDFVPQGGYGGDRDGVLLSDEAEAAGPQADQPPRYNPVPPRAVMVRSTDCPVPVGRQAAGCVFLYEGDALAPGLLTNESLYRFPSSGGLSTAAQSAHSEGTVRKPGTASSGGGDDGFTDTAARAAAAARIPGKDNYYKLSRGIPRHGRLSCREDVHLVIFCSGLGFDDGFVRPLCERVEALLPGYCPPHGGAGAGAGGGHWKSVTCVLLLRKDIHVTSPHYPLFRCVHDWSAVSLQRGEQRVVPSWCQPGGSGGLRDSTASIAHFDTTWMSDAPAWLLHFRY